MFKEFDWKSFACNNKKKKETDWLRYPFGANTKFPIINSKPCCHIKVFECKIFMSSVFGAHITKHEFCIPSIRSDRLPTTYLQKRWETIIPDNTTTHLALGYNKTIQSRTSPFILACFLVNFSSITLQELLWSCAIRKKVAGLTHLIRCLFKVDLSRIPFFSFVQ